MKRLNNKGFSLVEILAAVAILAILMAIASTAYNRYKRHAKQEAYDAMAKSAKDAAENYLMDNPATQRITFEKLWEEQYIDTIVDPGKQTQNCSGKVIIEKEQSTDNKTLDMNKYTVNVCCKRYNYTYFYPEGTKLQDEECKAELYNVNDITEIKVLHVYPSDAVKNNLTNWMNSYGSYNGNQVILVDKVSIENFNTNPKNYLGIAGRWKYDVIVFGFADCNANKDLSAEAASVVDEFLNKGHSAIFGHDTITKGCGNHVNFIKLKDHVALEMTNPDTSVQGTQVKIARDGIFTKYPYEIGRAGTVLSVPNTHVYGQIAKGDVWLTFNGSSDPYRSIYLSTYRYNAFIQTGHQGGSATADEQKIIANIIFYAKAKQLGL